MSGDLDDDTLAQIATGFLIERRFAACFFDEGTSGFWNGLGNITMDDGYTYLGTGKAGDISAVPATTDMSIPAVSVTLSGLDDDVLTDFFTKTWHLRRMTIKSRLFAPSMRSVFASPLFTFSGLMDKATRGGGNGQKAVLVLTLEDAMRRSTLNTVSIRSDGDQRNRLSTDTALQYVSEVGRTEQYWGIKQPAHPKHTQTITGLPPKKF